MHTVAPMSMTILRFSMSHSGASDALSGVPRGYASVPGLGMVEVLLNSRACRGVRAMTTV